MASSNDKGLLLGKVTPVVEHYAPELLFPIPRSQARSRLSQYALAAATGADRWHAYELSWLSASGCPQVRVGRIDIPATTTNIVESKSFKLYLNSLNNTRFASEAALHSTVVNDVSAIVEGEVSLTLFEPTASALAGTHLEGHCLDGLEVAVPDTAPEAALLHNLDQESAVDEAVYTHLMRSLCPVTGQPDWATLWLRYRGRPINHASLLRYILAYRDHQDFHEQCVERIFTEVYERCRPESLAVQGFYTRRGGMDINPFRSTDARDQPLPRMNRQ